MGQFTLRGIHPAARKRYTRRKPLADLETPPKQVSIPLELCAGCAPAVPVVKEGAQVRVGQLIARPGDENGVSVHASVSGTVEGIMDCPHPWGGTGPAIVIRSDGKGTLADDLPDPVDTAHLVPQVLIQRVRQAGIVGMGGDAGPTHVKLAQAMGRVDTLIVDAAECEPYNTADQRLLADRGDLLLQGALALSQAIRAKRVVLAAQGDQIKTVEKLERWLLKKKISIEIVLLRSHYPLGEERQIVRAVTGREVPPGGAPVDVKCLVLNAATVYAVSEAMLHGDPLTHRAVTVSGRGVARPRNLWVPIGTPLRELLASAGGLREEKVLFLIGGPMRGVEQKDLSAPVLPDTNSLICMLKEERAESGPQTPCVRCGRCAAACPMRLVPAFVARAFRLNDLSRLPALHPQDCLQCGCCTYICPSQIPLMDVMRRARDIVEKEGDRP